MKRLMSARALWQQYACDVCLAGPGDPCRTATGSIKREPHACRAARARVDGWQEQTT